MGCMTATMAKNVYTMAVQAIRHAMTHRHARRYRKTYIPLKTKNDERLRKKTIKYLQKRKKCIIFAPLTVQRTHSRAWFFRLLCFCTVQQATCQFLLFGGSEKYMQICFFSGLEIFFNDFKERKPWCAMHRGFSFISFHEPSVAKYSRADRRQWAFLFFFFTFLVLNLQCFSIYKA